jgi:DNA helicase HerA-like ATPase
MFNRHGLIAGATGTGKTVTLQRIIDELSKNGVPVFTADIKGDLAGICMPGGGNPKVEGRVTELELSSFSYSGNPTIFWDLSGKAGLPLRTTLSEVGPTIMAQMLGLNATQSGALQALFRAADDDGLLLLDLKDMKALITWAGENLTRLSNLHGLITRQTLAVIQREVINLEELGGGDFFGEPAFSVSHLLQRDFSGRGVVSILDATQVVNRPRIYCAFLMWLLSELFEVLPEQGDAPLPKLVFFFDEAHLLFRDADRELLEKVERLVKLIRSKGVGVFFITQNPGDIPATISAQLGHRIQHALRAYSEQERKALRSISQSLRANPEIDTAHVLENLAIGEALVSVLDGSGIPTPVQITKIAPPSSRLGPVSAEERAQVIGACPLSTVYTKPVDRESAFEILKKRASTFREKEGIKTRTSREPQGIFEAFIKSTARTIGSQVGRQIVRGIFGSIFRQR